MYDIVLFDLDGTLTDPGEGITNSVAYALNKFGITVKNRADLEYSAKVEHPDRFELNSATAQNEQSNRQN